MSLVPFQSKIKYGSDIPTRLG